MFLIGRWRWKDDVDVKVYADLPKEIQESRKKQWPRWKRTREEGKLGFFCKKEPDKFDEIILAKRQRKKA